jgi:hypothetical protein
MLRKVFTIALLLAAAIAAGAEKEKKPAANEKLQLALPAAEAVEKARRQVEELFGEKLKRARRPTERAEVGREMLSAAGKAADDPAAQYVLCVAARNLGAEIKDWMLIYGGSAIIAERFQSPQKADGPEVMLAAGDAAVEAARKVEGNSSKTRRLAWQLAAAEWYCRVQRHGTAIQAQLAEKRLTELAASMGCRNKDADLMLLIGTWEVKVGKGVGYWTFFADGRINARSGKDSFTGLWTAEPGLVRITWERDQTAMETFPRPIIPTGLVGNSRKHGKESVFAKRLN